MRYYEAHESEYEKLRLSGKRAWDGVEFHDFFMRKFVEERLAEAPFQNGATVLDVGCGTGPLCCLLAERGFRATGVDVSLTAIEMAREEAKARGLEIDYRVADICVQPLQEDFYDLVIDGHCLHCLISEEHRAAMLNNIKLSLKPEGEFWIETMVGHEEMEPDPAWLMDENRVTWVKTGKRTTADCVKRDGEWFLPIRKIQKDADVLLKELAQAGFFVSWFSVIPPKEPGSTGVFQAVCYK